ncbi:MULTISPECIES: hypothetical protein [Pseudomonadota]|jgi:hypothetical protein|uniref:DUF2946 domain-containing protein n=1 Tax=Denitratimonas tolerans TaxID=1338420 RepID=A0AAW9R6D6_9GAMM|nr:hypothetical protein [Hydrogenophaga sp.]MDX9969254.1 hypothetical protein [Hydrogenophaga sp.]MEB2317021.1 hypothetical protein [Xanthomonadaceae bacterium]
MTRLHPRFLLPLLRVLVLGVLALGLAVQPVMTAAGEMYELAHDPSGMHSHGPHANDLGAELTATGAHDQDGSETLHVLLDFAHCCGAAAAVMPVLESLSALPVAGRLVIEKASPPPIVRLASPFKPPIFG